MPNATVAAMMRAEPSRNAVIAWCRSRPDSPAWYSVTASPAPASRSLADSASAWVAA